VPCREIRCGSNPCEFEFRGFRSNRIALETARPAGIHAARCPGSSPRRAAKTTRPRGVLDGHATLRRLRSRFDSWRGRCDAGARRYGGCLQSSFPVGSTPTGVFFKHAWLTRLGPAAHPIGAHRRYRGVFLHWVLNRQRRSVAHRESTRFSLWTSRIRLPSTATSWLKTNHRARKRPPSGPRKAGARMIGRQSVCPNRLFDHRCSACRTVD
jgi:hypothetical protein